MVTFLFFMQMKNCCYKFGGLKFDCFCLKGYTYSEDRVALFEMETW